MKKALMILSFTLLIVFLPCSKSAALTREETIDAALEWMLNTAEDSSYGYNNQNNSVGYCGQNKQYNCFAFVADGWKNAGIATKCYGGTSAMKKDFLKKGFTDVTSSVGSLSSSDGLNKGDILIKSGTEYTGHTHVAQYIGDNKLVEAASDTDGQLGDSKGNEIYVRTYSNFYFDTVLRYTGTGGEEFSSTGSTQDPYSSFPLLDSSDDFTCETIFLNSDGSEKELKNILDDIFRIIEIASPVIAIVLITIDYIKGIVSQSGDIKKINQRTLKRIAIATLITFLPLLLDLIFHLFGLYDLSSCQIGR